MIDKISQEQERYSIQKETFPEELDLEGRKFFLTRVRAYDQGVIYKSQENTFLRVGSPAAIGPEQETHEYFEARGFPMPTLLRAGFYQDQQYYEETSIGDQVLNAVFAEDFAATGKISQENFDKFFTVAKEFTEAQAKYAEGSSTLPREFFTMAQFPGIKEEQPDLQDLLAVAEQKIAAKLERLPLVPTHGDFNSANILEGGVIDFSYHTFAPVGYDLTCSLVNTYNFPKGVKPDFEIVRKSEYTEDQWQQVIRLGNDIYKKLDIEQDFEEVLMSFAVARMVWSAARMEHVPKLQQWRFEKLQRVLKAYNRDASYLDMITLIKE
jgi:hypothetical protein